MLVPMSDATKKMIPAIAPLKKKEERLAVEVAQRHLKGELSERYRIFPPELRIVKPGRQGAQVQRSIAVLVVDYGKGSTTEVLIDSRGKVLRSGVVEGFEPAFLIEEILEARNIAGGEPRVAKLVKGKRVFVSPFSPRHEAAQGRRQIGLHYVAARGRYGASLLADVVVDIAEGKLVQFEESPAPVERES